MDSAVMEEVLKEILLQQKEMAEANEKEQEAQATNICKAGSF